MGNYIVLNGQDSVLRQHLSAILAQQGWLVTVTDGASDLQRKVSEYGVPALLIYLPDSVDGAGEAISRLPQGTRLLALIAGGLEEDDAHAAEPWLQFDDFVVWPGETADANKEMELRVRIRSLLRPSPTQQLNGTVSEVDRHVKLSATEQRIVAKLEEAGGQVVPIEELAECISGSSTQKDRFNSLRVHVTRLRRKIEVDPAQPLRILTVRGVGYRLDLTGTPQRLA